MVLASLLTLAVVRPSNSSAGASMLLLHQRKLHWRLLRLHLHLPPYRHHLLLRRPRPPHQHHLHRHLRFYPRLRLCHQVLEPGLKFCVPKMSNTTIRLKQQLKDLIVHLILLVHRMLQRLHLQHHPQQPRVQEAAAFVERRSPKALLGRLLLLPRRRWKGCMMW